ncbi:unnamed protein product, partial [marine sediment metagenome]
DDKDALLAAAGTATDRKLYRPASTQPAEQTYANTTKYQGSGCGDSIIVYFNLIESSIKVAIGR